MSGGALNSKTKRLFENCHCTIRFSLFTNCQNRPCGKEFNTAAFVNLHIYNVYVNINLNIVSTKLFPQSDLLRYQRVYNSNIVL